MRIKNLSLLIQQTILTHINIISLLAPSVNNFVTKGLEKEKKKDKTTLILLDSKSCY